VPCSHQTNLLLLIFTWPLYPQQKPIYNKHWKKTANEVCLETKPSVLQYLSLSFFFVLFFFFWQTGSLYSYALSLSSLACGDMMMMMIIIIIIHYTGIGHYDLLLSSKMVLISPPQFWLSYDSFLQSVIESKFRYFTWIQKQLLVSYMIYWCVTDMHDYMYCPYCRGTAEKTGIYTQDTRFWLKYEVNTCQIWGTSASVTLLQTTEVTHNCEYYVLPHIHAEWLRMKESKIYNLPNPVLQVEHLLGKLAIPSSVKQTWCCRTMHGWCESSTLSSPILPNVAFPSDPSVQSHPAQNAYC
jgi:hypothetical protein